MSLLRSLDIHFTIRVEGIPPDLAFLGPTVRGLLGYGLRQSCCGHDADDGGRCALGEACAYSYLFEGPVQQRMHADQLELKALPQPFLTLVAPPHERRADPRRVTFGYRLFGNATDLAAEVATALFAREQFGFGARSCGYTVESIAIEHTTIWTRLADPSCDAFAEQIRQQAIRTRHIASANVGVAPTVPPANSTLVWRFYTPLSIGAPVRCQSKWTERLLDAACRRKWLLERAYGDQYARQRSIPRAMDASAFETVESSVAPFRFERRSTRHGAVVQLQGDLGTVSIHGPWYQHVELLASIARYGLGQSTTFGFGRVEFEVARVQTAATTPATSSTLRAQSRAALPRWVRLRGAPPTKPRVSSSPPDHK